MKAITLWQPWATLVAYGAKTIETRSWHTHYRGPLVIHAAKAKVRYSVLPTSFYLRVLRDHGWDGDYPRGSIVAVCNLTDCLETGFLDMGRVSGLDQELGDFSPERFAWFLENIRRLDRPVACRGRQGLWNPPETIKLLTCATCLHFDPWTTDEKGRRHQYGRFGDRGDKGKCKEPWSAYSGSGFVFSEDEACDKYKPKEGEK